LSLLNSYTEQYLKQNSSCFLPFFVKKIATYLHCILYFNKILPILSLILVD